jgi:NAD+ diphosphatase
MKRALYFAFRARELLVSDTFAVPAVRSLDELGLTPVRTQYLGTLEGEHCFSAELPADRDPPSGAHFRDLRSLFGRLRDELFAMAGRAVQIMEWDRSHQFCGACAAPTRGHETARARVCTACGLEAYPRLAPAIIVSIERGPEILLARSPHFPVGIYSTLAGFVEPGESLEEAVRREVREEVGIWTRNFSYFGSQPWPFPGSLMIGFRAEYESGEITPDGVEIEDAGFFHVDALPQTFGSPMSISNWLIEDFRARQR